MAKSSLGVAVLETLVLGLGAVLDGCGAGLACAWGLGSPCAGGREGCDVRLRVGRRGTWGWGSLPRRVPARAQFQRLVPLRAAWGGDLERRAAAEGGSSSGTSPLPSLCSTMVALLWRGGDASSEFGGCASGRGRDAVCSVRGGLRASVPGGVTLRIFRASLSRSACGLGGPAVAFSVDVETVEAAGEVRRRRNGPAFVFVVSL